MERQMARDRRAINKPADMQPLCKQLLKWVEYGGQLLARNSVSREECSR